MEQLSNLTKMNDTEIQTLLRKVDPVTLGIALLGSNDDVKNCIFRNMSKRACAQLLDDMNRYEKMSAKELLIFMNAGKIENLM